MINLNVQYNGGCLPDISLLTQGPIVVWFDGIIIVYYYTINTRYLFLLCTALSFCFCCVWWPGMAINVVVVSLQYNGGLLPDIILC